MTTYIAIIPKGMNPQEVFPILDKLKAYKEKTNSLEDKLKEKGFSRENIELFKKYNALEQVADTAGSLGDGLDTKDFVNTFKEQYGALFNGKGDGLTLARV